ncbi:hypothetical protein [Pseudomonas sp. EL_65y_Pfl2_R95]|uniref:hypothetical protein n=1 Tax=Pseudomonas sp. EL_65y_Pfl2_R95 TaxID=3088698 RepID=UPI0030DA12D0
MKTTIEQNPLYDTVGPDVAAPQLSASAVSWGAIFAGAAAAAALSLILLILGTGLGFSSVSPWSNEGVSAGTFGVSTIVWITITQLLAAGMGGYLAGRLRAKWIDVHTDEVYFRDTAHGFLAWSVATLVTAVLLSSVVGAIVTGGVKAGASVAQGVASSAVVATAGAAAASAGTNDGKGEEGSMGYALDSLFRPNTNTYAGEQGALTQSQSAVPMAEITRIFMNAVRTGTMPAEDTQYVGQLVAQRTGLTQQEAEKRVADTFTQVKTALDKAETTARQAADDARKASAYAAIWLFISLLIGAFIASFAATFGGRQRDV